MNIRGDLWVTDPTDSNHIILWHLLDKGVPFSDVEDESSDGTDASESGVLIERARVRSRFRHYKQRSNILVPLGIFWDIENCQVSFNAYQCCLQIHNEVNVY